METSKLKKLIESTLSLNKAENIVSINFFNFEISINVSTLNNFLLFLKKKC